MSQGLEASESLAQGTQRERRSQHKLKMQERSQEGRCRRRERCSRGRGDELGGDVGVALVWSRLSLAWTITRRFPMGTSPQMPR